MNPWRLRLIFIMILATTAPLPLLAQSSLEVAADGDVGIGTATPLQRLHITDSASSNGAKMFFSGPSDIQGHVFGVRSDVQNLDLQAESLRNYILMIDRDNNSTNGNFLISIDGDPNTDVFRVREDKRIRMNGASPNTTTHPLVVGTDSTDGNGAHLTAAGVWTNGSSRVNKTGITPLQLADAYEALMHLQPVRYQGKQQPEEEYVGFIAEDVPDLVAMEDRKGIAAMDIVGVLTRVVQEQQKVVQEQQELIEALQERLERLESSRESAP